MAQRVKELVSSGASVGTSMTRSDESTPAPLNTSLGVDLTPLNTSSGVDPTPLNTSSSVDLTPLNTSSGVDLTPLNTSSGIDLTPLNTSPDTDLTPLNTSSGIEMTPLSTSLGVDLTPLNTSIPSPGVGLGTVGIDGGLSVTEPNSSVVLRNDTANNKTIETEHSDGRDHLVEWFLSYEQFAFVIQQEPEMCQFFAEQSKLVFEGRRVDMNLDPYTRAVMASEV